MTNDDQQVTYAKEHKKEFLVRIIPEPAPPKEGRTAYLTAGGPGSGKSELCASILSQKKTCVIDADEFRTFFPNYNGDNAVEYQRAASYLVDYCFGKIIRKKLPLTLDSTFGSSRALQNVQRLLDHDYLVKLYYVYQDPQVSWSFAQKRARIVPKEAFKKTTLNAYRNVRLAWNQYGSYPNFELILVNRQKRSIIRCKDFSQVESIEKIIKGGF